MSPDIGDVAAIGPSPARLAGIVSAYEIPREARNLPAARLEPARNDNGR